MDRVLCWQASSSPCAQHCRVEGRLPSAARSRCLRGSAGLSSAVWTHTFASASVQNDGDDQCPPLRHNDALPRSVSAAPASARA